MGIMSDEELAAETPEERRERYRSLTIGNRKVGGKAAVPLEKQPLRPMQKPVWEGSKVRDHRGVPYVHASNPNNPVTAKQFANGRGHYEAQIKNLRNRSTPLPGKD